MKLEKGVPFTSQDLAAALADDEGTFLCNHGGQSYIVEAQSGHSIVSGPTPVGPRTPTVNQSFTATSEPWTITKLDNRPIGFRPSGEFYGNESHSGSRRSS